MKSDPRGAPRPAAPTEMLSVSGTASLRRNSLSPGSGRASKRRLAANQTRTTEMEPMAAQSSTRRTFAPILLGSKSRAKGLELQQQAERHHVDVRLPGRVVADARIPLDLEAHRC